MPGLSRRDFLKLTAAAASTLAAASFPNAENPPLESVPLLGRTTWPLFIYARPSFISPRLGGMHFNDLFPIRALALGDSFPHNRVWYRTDLGWVHSSSVQIVRYVYNQPLLAVPTGGFLAEVTVPMTPTWRVVGETLGVPSNFYYSAVFWVEDAVTDAAGQVWYRVGDDFHVAYYVAARHLRPIPAGELTPLAPDVLDKRIEINLTRQQLFAYENDQLVFTCKVASGLPGTETPRGTHRIRYKRPSRHMATGTDVVGPEYNLPGVPWCSYFTESGAALHGTYWHNDFGRRNSAGCVNLSPANAKKLYRWTVPSAAPDQRYLAADTGTRLIIY